MVAMLNRDKGLDVEIDCLLCETAARLSMPCLVFKIGESAAPDFTGSKIGGLPLAPDGFMWPHDGEGRPLALLAQVRCGDLRGLAGFPDDGVVQLFVRADGVEWGLGPRGAGDDADGFRVLYWDDESLQDAHCAARAPEGACGRLPFRRSCWRIEFAPEPETQALPTCDWRFDELFLRHWDAVHPELPLCGKREANPWCVPRFLNVFEYGGDEGEWLESWGWNPDVPCDQVGGFPSFRQTDPRAWPGLESQRLRRYDTVLFQLDSQHGDGVTAPSIMWGDAGVACFMINGEDLARRDFSRVMYTWDCM